LTYAQAILTKCLTLATNSRDTEKEKDQNKISMLILLASPLFLTRFHQTALESSCF